MFVDVFGTNILILYHLEEDLCRLMYRYLKKVICQWQLKMNQVVEGYLAARRVFLCIIHHHCFQWQNHTGISVRYVLDGYAKRRNRGMAYTDAIIQEVTQSLES